MLAGLSFTVARGEAMMLRGPNGAGKSTLLRVLVGLLAPETGEIRLDGLSRRAEPEAFGERIAYAGHLDAIKPQLSLAENLTFWAALYGGSEGGSVTAAVTAALEGFDLAGIADRPAHACSAGQKRRLGLARLLVARRALWLLDEPTVSLDRAAVASFGAVVRAHCAAGGLALIASHVDLDLGQGGELVLAPIAARGQAALRASDDPFLGGNWQ